MVCRGACPADDKSIAQTAGAVEKTAGIQKSLKGFLKKISTQARVREDVREKKSAGSRRERNRQGEALGRSARETAEEKRWDEARKKPPGGSAGTERKRNRRGKARERSCDGANRRAEPPSTVTGKRKADRRAEKQEPKQKGNALREMGREERTAGRLRKKQDGRG